MLKFSQAGNDAWVRMLLFSVRIGVANVVPNFFSNGVTSCGRTLSRKAKCRRLGLLSGTRLGFTSNGSRYSHCDFTEKLLTMDSSSRNGCMYSATTELIPILKPGYLRTCIALFVVSNPDRNRKKSHLLISYSIGPEPRTVSKFTVA